MRLAQEATDPHVQAELFALAARFLKLAEYRVNKRKKEGTEDAKKEAAKEEP